MDQPGLWTQRAAAVLRLAGFACLLATTRPALAQFQLPQPPPHGGPPRPTTQYLTYQFSYGSESDLVYRRDADLDHRLRDNSMIAGPQINGFLTYRPADWVDLALEMILEKELALLEQKTVLLPTGDTRAAEPHRWSLLVDQAFVRFHNVAGAWELILGRRNFEDDRRWLYDTSLDAIMVRHKSGDFQGEASFSREDVRSLDPFKRVPRGRNNNAMLYLEYRGIENSKLAAYLIARHDTTPRASKDHEGRPILVGGRAYGNPTSALSYWLELALLRGSDERARKFDGHAIDIGATYRFSKAALAPNLTLGYAYGSGEGKPDGKKNHEFRQTGLQSNELRFAGAAKFNVYGEALEPELSNLRILTAGLGFRPGATTTVDLVVHRYWLNELADTMRGSPITAEMSQVDTQLSRTVGTGLDLVFGFRNVFGIRRLGLDLRTGLFFPGKAYLRNEGTEERPVIRDSHRAIKVLAKFWW